MASTDGQTGLLIDVQNEINGLRATVIDLVNSVAHLRQDITGLTASRDGSVYGEEYADDNGPAVRAKYFEDVARASAAHDVRLV